MLQTEVGDVIAECVEEVVVAVVVRAEKFLRLIDETFVVLPNFGRGVERGGAVGGDVHFGERILGEGNNLQEFSGDDGRVNQRGEGNGGELDFISALAGHGKRSAELPAFGKLQAGRVVDVVGLVAFGVEQYLVPTDDGQLVGGGGTGGESAFEGCGRKKVEFGGDFGHACGDVDVEGEAVEQVAAPFQRLASGKEFQAREIDDRAVGGVLARDPLGVVEREVAGSRGNFQRGMENLAGSRAGVDGDGDGGGSCGCGCSGYCGERGGCQDCDADCSQGSGEFHFSGALIYFCEANVTRCELETIAAGECDGTGKRG